MRPNCVTTRFDCFADGISAFRIPEVFNHPPMCLLSILRSFKFYANRNLLHICCLNHRSTCLATTLRNKHQCRRRAGRKKVLSRNVRDHVDSLPTRRRTHSHTAKCVCVVVFFFWGDLMLNGAQSIEIDRAEAATADGSAPNCSLVSCVRWSGRQSPVAMANEHD